MMTGALALVALENLVDLLHRLDLGPGVSAAAKPDHDRLWFVDILVSSREALR